MRDFEPTSPSECAQRDGLFGPGGDMSWGRGGLFRGFLTLSDRAEERETNQEIQRRRQSLHAFRKRNLSTELVRFASSHWQEWSRHRQTSGHEAEFLWRPAAEIAVELDGKWRICLDPDRSRTLPDDVG